ncbi:MAG: hypothetical protein OEW69_06525, partial [Nitrospirota bacterium]|nr:hypothetical protein [Nitrospirota bacterium]
MKELLILLAPVLWSLKNDISRVNRSFYKKALFYTLLCITFIFLMTNLLNTGMIKLQTLSSEVFHVLLVKAYSLIFIIIFFIQIISAFILALNTFYQSRELEVLFTSPVNRISLFFSRLFETHLKASWMLIIFGLPLLISAGVLFHASPFYYIYSLLIFIAFAAIPVNIGICLAILTSGIFNIRKLKKFLFSGGIIAIIVIITLLRIFKPERFINPELFANLTLFISEMKTPSFLLLPNRWLSESLFNFLNRDYSSTFIFVALLFLTSYITTVLLQVIFIKYHYRGWILTQEGGVILKDKRQHASYISNFIKKILSAKPFQLLLSVIDTRSRILIRKDIAYQIRDIKNVHQILILLSLIVVYLFSIISLPLNWEGFYAVKLKYIISFFNLGLILLIITSFCSRLVCPAISSEGNSLWIIRTSPATPKRYVWTKFFFFFIPVFLFGQLLTVSSSLFIGIEKPLLLLEIMTTTLLSLSFVSLALMFSVSDLRRSMYDSVKEQTRTGSAVYMVISFLLILFTLTLEIVPIF